MCEPYDVPENKEITVFGYKSGDVHYRCSFFVWHSMQFSALYFGVQQQAVTAPRSRLPANAIKLDCIVLLPDTPVIGPNTPVIGQVSLHTYKPWQVLFLLILIILEDRQHDYHN